MISILDKAFRYKSAAQTDLKSTFARVRREMKAQKERDAREHVNVSILKRKT